MPATEADRLEFIAAARAVRWLGLTVHRAERGRPGDDEGVVEFTARSRDARWSYALHERSRFRRVAGRWRYVDGEARLERTLAGAGPLASGLVAPLVTARGR